MLIEIYCQLLNKYNFSRYLSTVLHIPCIIYMEICTIEEHNEKQNTRNKGLAGALVAY